MDVYLTDLQDPNARVIEPDEQGTHIPRLPIRLRIAAVLDDESLTGPSGRTFGLGARGKISRARAVLSFVPAKTSTGANAASQSGLRAAGGRRKGTIERTVPVCAYGRWTMFVKAFQNTIRVFSHRRALGVSWGRGVLSRLGALRLARACTRVYVLGARGVGALRLFAGPVFAVTFTQPVARGLVLLPAIAFPGELIKPKPATRAQNLAKPMTGAGGPGKYANVMKPKQLPLRLGTLQKACAVPRRTMSSLGPPTASTSVITRPRPKRFRNLWPACLQATAMNKPGRRSSNPDGHGQTRAARRGHRKTTYSGLKGPQTSQPPTIWVGGHFILGSQVAAPGVVELIVDEGGRALNPLGGCPASPVGTNR